MFPKLAGTTPLLLGSDENLTHGDVGRQGEILCDALRASGATRVMIASDRPSRLLAAIVAAARMSADLWIVGGNQPAEKLESMAREFGVGLLLSDAADRLLKSEPVPSTGRICLMTSGTTGQPKIVAHTLVSLANRALAVAGATTLPGARWLLTYQPTAFAGLQVILTATCTGGAIVTTSDRNYLGWFNAAREHEVTHISGTPTFWRGFLMVAEPGSLPSLRQATLGGEAIDQPTLDRLHYTFSKARITHIYASTEAGVVFSVNDGRSGFPAAWLDKSVQGVEMRIRDGILEVHTPRAMLGYLSRHEARVSDDGWLSTGDRVQISGDRVQFLGREDSVINVGGSKVHPHVVEAFLLGCDDVIETRVFGCANPITGSIIGAELVVAKTVDKDALRAHLLRQCREHLPTHQVPRVLRFVDSIQITESGKKG